MSSKGKGQPSQIGSQMCLEECHQNFLHHSMIKDSSFHQMIYICISAAQRKLLFTRQQTKPTNNYKSPSISCKSQERGWLLGFVTFQTYTYCT